MRAAVPASVIVYLLEVLATGDLVTDILVLIQLSRTNNAGFFAMTILSMLAPLYIGYMPFLDYLTENDIINVSQRINKNERTCRLRVIGLLSLSPIMLVYM